ncbi:hypothetical protein [Bacillus massiliglaciei]|uniref:hypothetical protein n=1 Tax=Bacillus massiliglaciei TaxID=1816693 RepID=UPI000DA5F66C|nr:hypothetical protein [Bacillus massiliglaciei]
MLKILRKICYKIIAIIIFLFVFKYVDTQMGQGNYDPMVWLFTFGVVVVIIRMLLSVFKKAKHS